MLAVVAILWWGRSFLIPLTAGLMLAMLVMPLTVRLTHWLRSTVAATVLTLLMVMGALGAGVVAQQLPKGRASRRLGASAGPGCVA